MKKVLFILIGLIFLFYVAYKIFRFATIDIELDAKIKSGAIILDVRTPLEYNEGHVNGSINIPLGKIREEFTKLDTNKTYITCCSHGLRSVKVKQILKNKGFKHIFNGGVWTDFEKL